MAHARSKTDSVVARGREIYERKLRDQLEDNNRGRFVAIDPETGDFALADDELGAIRALRAQRPGVEPYIARIGAATTYRIGRTAAGGQTP